MRATIANHRGVRQADIALDAVTLLAGRNGAGKSSILNAIRAAALGRPVPGVTKPSKELVGQQVGQWGREGAITLGDDQGQVTVVWPSGSVTGKGQPLPASSEIALGLVSLPELAPKERAEALVRLLKAEATAADLTQALLADGLTDDQAKAAAAALEKRGWDGIHADEKTAGAKAKGAWEAAATGERYGSQKASSWRPPGWEPNLALVKDRAELTIAVDRERQAYDAFRVKSAVGADQMARLQEQVADIARLEREAEQANLHAQRTANASRQLAAELRLLPLPIADGQPCPHCGGHVTVGENGGLSKAIHVDRAENERRNKAIGDLRTRLNQADADATAAAAAANRVAAELSSARGAKTKLDEAMAQNRVASGNAETEAWAKAALDHTERRLRAWDADQAASKAHADVLRCAAIVKATAPDGIRKRKLGNVIASFNERIDCLTAAAGLPKIEVVGDDLGLTFDAKPWSELSHGQQVLTRTVVQMAAAEIDGSDLLLVDVDRPLDRWSLNAVLTLLLRRCDARSVIAVTHTDPAKGLPTSSPGELSVYWVKGGEVHGLSDGLGKEAS